MAAEGSADGGFQIVGGRAAPEQTLHQLGAPTSAGLQALEGLADAPVYA